MRLPRAALAVALLVALCLTRWHGLLLFHSLAEIFSIVIGFAIFAIFWNARRFLDNGYFLFIGVAYLFIALIDLLHTLAFKGMGVFAGDTTNLATQLWIAARYLEAGSLLAAGLLVDRKPNPAWLLAGFAAVTGLLLASIFGGVFPACYRDGAQTPVKIGSELVICVLLLVSVAVLWRRRAAFDPSVFRLLALSILATVGAEMAFMGYKRVTDWELMVGHVLKIISFYLIYKAMIEVSLRRPYALIFRNLKQSEEALRQSEERFRTVADFTYDWEYWVGPDGRYVYVSPSCERITGYRAAEFVGDPRLLETITHPDDRQRVAEHLKAEQRAGPLDLVFRISTRDGRQRWIEHLCQPVYGAEGRYLGRRANNRDVTERRLAEEAARDAQRLLLDHQQRDRERVEQELAKATDRLVRQTQLATIGQISASIAHDLRNPLAAIRYLAYALRRRLAEQPESRDYVGKIEGQVDMAGRIIDNLMEMARAKEPVKQPIDLGELLGELSGATQLPAGARCEVELDHEPFVVTADPVQLRQVLANLLGNAAQAVPQGGRIRVRARPEDGADVITVEDSGRGIPEEVRGRLFEPLVTTKPKGTGLGLAISQQIVERHGGTIDLFDTELGGAGFQVRLPRADDAFA